MIFRDITFVGGFGQLANSALASSNEVLLINLNSQSGATKGSSVWECKVGWTVGEPDARVIGQGALTAFPRPPIIGLIKTEDGRRLEHALHSALTLAGKRVKGGGSEWFMTSPEQIERWVQAFWNSLTIFDSLRNSLTKES